jgi:hypothetical protein
LIRVTLWALARASGPCGLVVDLPDQIVQLLSGQAKCFGLVAEDVSGRLLHALAEVLDALAGLPLDLLGLVQEVAVE